MRFYKYLRVHGRLAGRRAWHIFRELASILLSSMADIAELLFDTLDRKWRSDKDGFNNKLERLQQAHAQNTADYINSLKREIAALYNKIECDKKLLQSVRNVRDITEMQHLILKFRIEHHERTIGPVSSPSTWELLLFINNMDVDQKIKDDIIGELEMMTIEKLDSYHEATARNST